MIAERQKKGLCLSSPGPVWTCRRGDLSVQGFGLDRFGILVICRPSPCIPHIRVQLPHSNKLLTAR
jgi:hypothetical protein